MRDEMRGGRVEYVHMRMYVCICMHFHGQRSRARQRGRTETEGGREAKEGRQKERRVLPRRDGVEAPAGQVSGLEVGCTVSFVRQC